MSVEAENQVEDVMEVVNQHNGRTRYFYQILVAVLTIVFGIGKNVTFPSGAPDIVDCNICVRQCRNGIIMGQT